MHSSGKLVNSGLISHGKTRAKSSTAYLLSRFTARYDSVQPRFTHIVFPFFAQHFSPLKIALSPLIEHYFYPVSTGPINSTTK
jgi:hypothetical protein